MTTKGESGHDPGAADDASDSPPAERSAPRAEVAAARSGALTAAISLLPVLALVLLAALAVPRADATPGEALGAGAATWLVLGGARLSFGDGVLALTPLLALAALVVLARAGARRALRGDEPWTVPACWVAGWAGVGAAATLLTLLGPVQARPLSLLLPLVVLPTAAVVLAAPTALRDRWSGAPLAWRRGLGPGVRGAALLLAIGAALLTVAVVVHASRVWQVHTELGPGLVGGLLLLALQVAAAPNLGIWALSLAAGPGFSVTQDASTTWSQAEAGVLPMIPVLAAAPAGGAMPWVTHLLVLLPLAAGAWIARATLREVPRLAATGSKLAAVACAVAVAAAAVVGLDAIGGGSLGAVRLADLGAPALPLGLALLIELGLGALAVLARDWWRLRR